MPGGFGSPMNRCTNFDSANDFITVIFPGNVNFLLDHVFGDEKSSWIKINTSVFSCQECNNFQFCSFDSSKSVFVCKNPLAVFFFLIF